ncbi:MAG: hypothetical protein ACTSRG_18920 [Candidatus Helarchaeota archaeon]
MAEWMEKISEIDGMEIVYDWTKHSWQDDRRKIAEENIAAVKDCDIFVFDVGDQGSLGKSILLGVALALEKQIYVIGGFPEIIFGELILNKNKFDEFNKFIEFLKK